MFYNKTYNHVKERMSFNKVYYHTIEHINNMLLLCNRIVNKEKEFHNLELKEINLKNTDLKTVLKIPERLFYAILFHDVIYDVKNKYNELDSANYFKSYAIENNIKLSKEDMFIVSEMIYATKNHKEINHDNENIMLESMLLMDLDLSSLSSDFIIFNEDNDNIVKEYQTFYTQEQVLQGRKKFLEGLLNKEQIYLTETFKKNEFKLKQNIQKQLLEF